MAVRRSPISERSDSPLRNYTENAYGARIGILLAGRIAFGRTYQLPNASGADPYQVTETDAVSYIPDETSYTVSLFLGGTEVGALEATMDCRRPRLATDGRRKDIDIGFGAGDTVQFADSTC